MIGLLSAVFNISVCVGFPITVFIVLLAKSKKLNTELKIFIVGIRSVYKELHADHETGC